MSAAKYGKTRPTATANAHKAAGNWAGNVSRILRTGGVRARGASDPAIEETLRVKASEVGMCTVLADYDNPRDAASEIEHAEAILRAAGYTVERGDIVDSGEPILKLLVTRNSTAALASHWKKRKDPMKRTYYQSQWWPAWVIDVTDDGFVVRQGKAQPEPPFETLVEAVAYVEEQPR